MKDLIVAGDFKVDLKQESVHSLKDCQSGKGKHKT